MKLSEELQWRGFVNQTTYKDITALDGQPISFYWGVDPSAPSMQIGNLAAAMMVRHFIEHGHKAYLLVGGATGMIGDPDGKSEERELKSPEEIASNKAGIVEQYKTIFGGQMFTIVDNYDWFKDMNYLTFLRDIGKHIPLRQMLARDFVQSRLGEGGAGISYAEFSYALIQGYDFLHLHKKHGVDLQVCGADQWGNSITGVDLIRRKTGDETHVWSVPLVVNKLTGQKFGKSESGAIWLDPKLTSVYQFYQFWLNVDDEGVSEYLKIFTLLNKEKIAHTMTQFEHNKAERLAQKTLAYEVTKLIHGKEAAETQVKISRALFQTRDFHGFSKDEFRELEPELPFAVVGEGESYVEALVKTGLASSNSEARRLIEQGAIWNGKELFQITINEQKISRQDSLDGYIVLVKGKKHVGLVKIK